MKNRFIATIIVSLLVISVYAGDITHLVILHTNDTHSQVEPKTDNNMGGYARRMGEIELIRSENKNVLLFDAGDFSQGTPYFNFYRGRVEIEAMNMMKYDAATLGNHEFDNGMDTLAMVLRNAKFPIVNANYDVKNTPLKELIKPYIVINKGGLKIGVFGLGVQPEGLIFQKNFAGMIYENPVKTAIATSNFLRNKEKCDLVVCLSHLGANTDEVTPTDWIIAQATTNIDIIIGGHSHQIIDNTTTKNANGKDVIIAQMGKSGQYLGRIDLTFEKK